VFPRFLLDDASFALILSSKIIPPRIVSDPVIHPEDAMSANTYGLLLLTPAFVSLLLILVNLRHRGLPIQGLYIALLSAMFIYSLGYAMELMSSTLPVMMQWIRVEYLGAAFLPALWIWFAARFTGYRNWLSPARTALLFLIPMITLGMVQSNSLHHLYYLRLWVNETGPTPLLGFERGPFYWLHMSYLNLAILAGNLFFLKKWLSTRSQLRDQAMTVFISSMIPWIGLTIYILGGTPWRIDTNSLFMTFAALGFLIGDLRFHMFDLQPIAHAQIFQGMEVGVVVLDPFHHLLDVNPAGLKLLSPPVDFQGLPLEELQTPIATEILELLRSGENRREIRLDDGSRSRWIGINLSPLNNRRGRLIGKLVHLIDITVPKQAAEEQLTLQKRVLEAGKAESLGLMAGGIAHDYNNLLQVVLGNLDLALRKLGPAAVARDFLEDAARASRRAADLTHEILAFSGKGGMMLRDCALDEIAGEVATVYADKTPSGVVIECEPAPGLPPVKGDPQQLGHILSILVQNACEAMRERRGTITVDVSAQRFGPEELAAGMNAEHPAPGLFGVITVTDQGPGMTPEVMSSAFDPFFSTKGVGKGLGLAALHGIVRAHHGAVFLDSTPGGGLSVRVLIPTAVRPTETAPVAKGAITRGVVLVIDDEAPVREVARRMATSLGYPVVLAADGQEAADWVAAHPGGALVALLDLIMPGMDGYTTFRELRRLEPELEIILCSGYSERDATNDFEGLSLSGFLQKPFTLGELETAIRRATN
jgi:signal transduction histidine kinase/CheY-like chemotaxis protein